MEFAIALAVKPLALIVLFGVARLLAILIMKMIPPGKVRDFLMRDDGKYP